MEEEKARIKPKQPKREGKKKSNKNGLGEKISTDINNLRSQGIIIIRLQVNRTKSDAFNKSIQNEHKMSAKV